MRAADEPHANAIPGDRWVGGGQARGAKYADILATLTLGGALGMCLKQIANGREPQKPNNGDFWLAALAPGRRHGHLRDFLFADYNRYGNSLAATIMGPQVQAVEDAVKVTIGQGRKFLADEKTNLSDEALRTLRKYTPGGTIWYLRAAYNRVVLDQLQYLIDPKASQRFKTKVRNSKRERDQGFWWVLGDLVPGG